MTNDSIEQQFQDVQAQIYAFTYEIAALRAAMVVMNLNIAKLSTVNREVMAQQIEALPVAEGDGKDEVEWRLQMIADMIRSQEVSNVVLMPKAYTPKHRAGNEND